MNRFHIGSLVFLVCIAAVLAARPAPAGTKRPQPVVAVRAADFLDSIGANSAVSVRGERLDQTVKAVRYLGLRWIRSGYESNLPVEDLLELHRQTGIRFSYGLASGGTDIPRLLDGARRLAAAGALLAIEGNNEPNNWGVTYQGEKGGRNLSWLPVAKLQRDLYQSVKKDPVLRKYPVWSISESGAETDNVGLQFLAIPPGADTLMPSGTRYADFANCHNYMTHPNWPGLHDNQTWVAADPTSACKVDGLYGNCGLTWLKKFRGYTEAELVMLPKVTTETGVTIEGPFTEHVQALLYMSVYLSQFKRGWKHTCIYILRDRSDEAGNQSFGFYTKDYVPRQAAHYLHNLTTILHDRTSPGEPGKLAYSIPDEPATVHDLLLQKSDGTFDLVIWGERFTGGSDEVRVLFARPLPQVRVYDPTVGTEPVRTLRGISRLTLAVSDHPILIEVGRR
ncbi:MAG: glycosyl hydrolase [Chthonomonadales bacterium]